MVVRLADLFDGEMHLLEPGEDFTWPVDKVIVGWEEVDEDEPLGPYESPALEPVFSDTPYLHGAWLKEPRDKEKHQIGQGWGSFSVAMSTFVHLTKSQKHQMQRCFRSPAPDVFEFQFKPIEGEWQGGPI